MRAYNAVIIDDEKRSREVLRSLLETFCQQVRIVAEADSVASGISVINAQNPDIVFLDIEMRSGTGFDLLRQLDDIDFEVIFTTAFSEYAIKAIRHGAVDYLLKPIDIEDLKTAVKNTIVKREKDRNNSSINELLRSLKNERKRRISLSTAEGVLYVNVEEIIRCEASGAYTTFFLKTGNKIITSKNLKEYEIQLSDYNFFRVHHSHIVNMAEIRMYIKSDSMIELTDGSRVSVSNQKKDVFLQRMREQE